MRVKGDISSVQSSLDFYINVSSGGNISSIKGLRKHYFNIFLNEERSQMRLRLDEIKELENQKQQKLEEESLLESKSSKLESESLTSSEVPDISDSPEEDLFFSSKFFLRSVANNTKKDDIKVMPQSCSEETYEGVNNSVYASHGVYLDEIEPQDTKTEFKGSINHGVMLDDVVVNLETESEAKVEHDVISTGDYVEHGVMLDDVAVNLETLNSTTNAVEDLESVEELKSSEELEPVDSPITTGLEEDNLDYTPHGVFLDEYVIEEAIEESEGSSEQVVEDYSEFEDTPEVLENIDSEKEYKCAESKEVVQDSTALSGVSQKEEPLAVPMDLRAFLKQHPGSTIEYVGQFYPMKEIDKQIKLGRVYKKKGKLFI